MGVKSLLHALRHHSSDSGRHSSSSVTRSVGKISRESSEFSFNSRRSGYVTFTLPNQLYEWVKAMAVDHNYGSINKSVRNILTWAENGHPDDIKWMFTTKHEVPSCLDVRLCPDSKEARGIAEKSRSRRTPCNRVTLDARLPESLCRWVMNCVTTYGLNGPSEVLEAACKCAISLGAEEDIFDSHDTGQDLPRTSADLYHDLGIMNFATSPASSNVDGEGMTSPPE